MMKALVFRGPFDVRLEEKPVPQLKAPTDVIIKTTSAALCGSELHRYRGHSKINMTPGYVCGHEGIGIVHEAGSGVANFSKGDRVIAGFCVSDSTCFNCRRGHHGRCKQGVNFGGTTLDGSQAEYFRCPLADTTLHSLPMDLGEEAILMTDIFPTGFNAAKRAFAETPKDRWSEMKIAIIGCGPVALCAMIAAREYKPAEIFAIDCIPSRLAAAQSLGCTPINFKQQNPVEVIKAATDGNGAEAVIEGVGASAALQTAYDVACPGGKISSFGVHNGDIPFSAADCYNKDVHIQFGRCPLNGVYDQALEALRRNVSAIRAMNFVDLILPGFDGFEDALRRFEKGELNKVIFKPNGLDA